MLKNLRFYVDGFKQKTKNAVPMSLEILLKLNKIL